MSYETNLTVRTLQIQSHAKCAKELIDFTSLQIIVCHQEARILDTASLPAEISVLLELRPLPKVPAP